MLLASVPLVDGLCAELEPTDITGRHYRLTPVLNTQNVTDIDNEDVHIKTTDTQAVNIKSKTVSTQRVWSSGDPTRGTVGVEYDDSGTVRGILESTDVEFDAEYGASVTFEVRVPETRADAVRDPIQSATSGRATFGS
jgi:hypothetical protein